MPTIDVDNFNLVNASIGGFFVLFALVSSFVRETIFISEPLPCLLIGLAFQKAGWIRPDEYGNTDSITLEICRLVLGIQLMLAGVQLPSKYLKRAWFSLSSLLVVVMTLMWVVTALIIYLVFPGHSYLESLIIGACVTPTDPVLCTSIVKGPFAEKFVSERLREIIMAESGANDGFGYPFLFLALFIYRYSGVEIAKKWLVETVCYEILLSMAYGAVAGFIAQEVLFFAKKKNLVDHESFLIFVFALAMFIMGTAGMIGTDDLLACFIAGNTFTWNDEYRIKTMEDSLQPAIDMILNFVVFVWIGAVLPWNEFDTERFPAWRFVVFGIVLMLFRRIPAIVVSLPIVPEVRSEDGRLATLKNGLFVGYFGPIGVGALFYLKVCQRQLEDFVTEGLSKASQLSQDAGVIVGFSILTSVVVHGLSITVLGLGDELKNKVRENRRTQISRSTTLYDSRQVSGKSLDIPNDK